MHGSASERVNVDKTSKWTTPADENICIFRAILRLRKDRFSPSVILRLKTDNIRPVNHDGYIRASQNRQHTPRQP